MNWYSGTIPEAVAEAKQNNKLLLVYIEGSDEMSQSMNATYDDPSVSSKLASKYLIALKLTADSVAYRQFCAIYPVLVIPSSFFIAGNGSPVEIITGSLTPQEFQEKLILVFTAHGKWSGLPPESAEEPSTSQEGASNISLEDKVERAKALIEAKKIIKNQEEKEREKNEEMERRNMGRAMQQAEQTKRDNEMQEWAKNRAKEKEEERLAREKVKAMIAQDRAERAAKYQVSKEAEQAEKERQARAREETERSLRNAAMTSNDARIQFRMPDGSHTTHCFSADDTLQDARTFVTEEIRPPFSHFTLCTTFPRRQFGEGNYSETLRDLQLAPSAVLLILPAQAVSSPNPSVGLLTSLFWMVTSPLRNLWTLLMSFFRQTPAPPAPPPAPEAEAQDTRSETVRKRDASFAKREGNVFRLNNQSDDDDNNTWNGNSTQQM